MTLEELVKLEMAAKAAAKGSRAIAVTPGELASLCELARKALEPTITIETLEGRINAPVGNT